ncbi:MAG: hypothetical protein ACI8V2_001962 [Candidatus Latescibacterota bacterium]|jgi:hypothetical protein
MTVRSLFALLCVLTLGSSSIIDAQQTVTADFDNNGAVDFLDFSRLVSQFGLVSDSTRFQSAVDLNQDSAIDGQDAFLFADVFGNSLSTANLTVSTGENTNGRVALDPTDNGFLVYLNDVTSIGGYRIVLTMPDTVKVRSVEDHLGIGLLPIRRTASGVEIVGLVLGNRNLNASGLIAGITFTGDTTGVVVQSVSLRGKRVNLGNQRYLGDRNTIPSANVKRVPIGDVVVRARYFDLGEVVLGETRTRSFDIVNAFNNQQVLGASRKLSFEIDSSTTDLAVDTRVFGVLADTSTGLANGGTQKINMTFTPTQTGAFQGVLSVKTNRSERPVVRVHVKADVRSILQGSRIRAVANFDTLKLVDYGDFNELITRFGKTPDATKFDLDGNGVVGGDDAFLFADLLGGFDGRASYDTVRVLTGKNLSSAVRVESVGEELTVSVRGLTNLGGYRLNLIYDTSALDLRWAKDLTGGGMMPIHRTNTGAEVVAMGFGGLLETASDLPLARISVRPLSGQADAASLVRVTGGVFRGDKGERDSVGAVHIGSSGLDASPRVLDFGSLRIGATAQKTFRVHNLNSVSTAFQVVSSDSQVTNSPRSVGNLGGGRTWDVTVTYRSVAPGPFASTLTLSANDADISPIQIAVRAVGAVVGVVPDSLVFGDTFVGQNTTQSVTITNPDLTPFDIQDLRFARLDTSFVVDAKPVLPLSISSEGGIQRLTVRFNPLAQGDVLDTLYIVGTDTSFAVPLRGRGLRRSATLSAVAIGFGNVDVGKDSTLSVVVGNVGNVTYRVDSLTVGRKDSSFAFVAGVTFPDTLAVGRFDTVRVRFRPDTTGVKRDTLRIFGQDTIWAVALHGTGLPRQVIQPPPLEDVVVITFGGSITKSRNEILFGKVPWGVSDTAKVRVQNRRSGNLTFRFSSTDSQVVVKPDSVKNLPPNQEWDVILTFTPKDSIQTVSAFRITTDEVGDGVTSLILKSGGSHPVLSDSLLSFGKIGIGNRTDKVITVTNTGHSRLVLDSLSLRADSNFVWVNSPTLPLSIGAGGGSQTFTVRFQPKVRGNLANTLRFSGLDTSFVLPVAGIGRESNLTFSADSLAFGLLRIGKRDSLSLTLANAGGDTVVVDSLRLVGTVSPYVLSNATAVPDTLIPGATRTVSVVFAPLVAGNARDTLQVIAGLDTLRTHIIGIGTVASATITRLVRDFGNLAVGRSRLDTVTITNAGNVPIASQSVRLIGGNRGFVLVQAPTDTLAVNGSLRYVTRFQPDTTGSVADTLRIQMADTTFSVTMTGQGTPSLTMTRADNGITFSPNQLDFGNLADGQTGRRIIRVTNAASTPWSFTTEGDIPNLTIQPGSFAGLPTTQSWELIAVWTPPENGLKLTALGITDTKTVVPVGRNGAFVRLLTDSLTYGSLRLASDSTQVLRVQNKGQGTVVIQSVTLLEQAGFGLVSPPSFPVSLLENDSLRVLVRFDPKIAGDATDTVRIVATDTVFSVPIKGRGIHPIISLNTEALDFGNVVSNTDSTQLVIFQNIGNGPFVLDSLKLVTNTTVFTFSAAPFVPSTILANGDADTVAIRFSPPDLGTYSGNLLFFGEKQTWTVPVSGRSTQTGTVASGVVISFGPTVTRRDSILNFGSVPFGSTRKLDFVVENNRDSTLTFSVVSPDAQVKIDAISDNSLLPSQNATVTVSFTPVVGGATTFDLDISNNAPTDGIVNIKVLKDKPPASVVPLVLNFGTVLIGRTDTLKTTILNPQELNFRVTQLNLARGQVFSLIAPPTLPDTVGANNGTRTLTVQFAPTARGTFNDTLLIGGDTQNFSVVIIGKSALAHASANVDSIQFGVVDVGADSVLSFAVSNAGDVALDWTGLSIEGPHFVLVDTLSLPDTLAVGDARIFRVRYAPSSGGQHLGNVSVTLGAQVIGIGLRGAGLAPPRVVAGPFALDLNLEIGDQAVRTVAVTGRNITLDLAVTEGALATSGFEVVLAFDTTAVAFNRFTLVDLYGSATPIISSAAGSAQFSVVFFGTETVSRDSGSAGRAQFTLLGNADPTQIRIVSASFATSSGTLPLEIGSDGAQVTVQGTSEPSADFDGDGEVGFTDFISFAGKFGTRVGQEGFDPRFDLDGDGSIGFPDFITFAGKFGTKTGKPVLSKPTSN